MFPLTELRGRGIQKKNQAKGFVGLILLPEKKRDSSSEEFTAETKDRKSVV